MSLKRQLLRITREAYLEGERSAEVRHEFVDGEVHAMVGGTLAHNRIAGRLHLALSLHLRNGPCQTYMSDVKVRVAAANAFYYPDLLVVCGPHDLRAVFVDDPCLIIEILSPATEAIDRRETFWAYQKLPSLREYGLVDQSQQQVDVFRPREDGEWELETYGAGDTLVLESVGLHLPLAELYAGIL